MLPNDIKSIDLLESEEVVIKTAEKKNLQKVVNKLKTVESTFDFENKTYITDTIFKNDNSKDNYIVSLSNKTACYEIKDNLKSNPGLYLYNRLKYYKSLLLTNDEATKNNDIAFNFVNNELSKSKTYNVTIINQLYVLINSIKNRSKILNSYKAQKNEYENKFVDPTLKYKQFISKGTIKYYDDILNNIYAEYFGGSKMNNVINNTSLFNSLVSSFILYKAFFNNLLGLLVEENEILNIKTLQEDIYIDLFKYFFIEIKPFLDGYKRANPKLQIKQFININDNVDAYNNLDATEKEVLGIKKSDRIFSKQTSTEGEYLNIKDNKLHLKFNKVFSNTDPTIMASYMAISTSLNNLEGTILYTFGASGTGKSYTLFGKDETYGIVQATLTSLDSVKGIKIKVYEVYGLGFNDLDYWNKNDDSICEKYIVHNIKFSANQFKYNSNDIVPQSFSQFKNNEEYGVRLTYEQIKDADFKSLIDIVDNKRKSGYDIFGNGITIKTIKATANNPESSRSILVYEFLVEKEVRDITERIEIPLILVDMPGKEIIANTYQCTAALKPCDDNENKKACSNDYSFVKSQIGKKILISMFNKYTELFSISKKFDTKQQLKENLLFSVDDKKKILMQSNILPNTAGMSIDKADKFILKEFLDRFAEFRTYYTNFDPSILNNYEIKLSKNKSILSEDLLALFDIKDINDDKKINAQIASLISQISDISNNYKCLDNLDAQLRPFYDINESVKDYDSINNRYKLAKIRCHGNSDLNKKTLYLSSIIKIVLTHRYIIQVQMFTFFEAFYHKMIEKGLKAKFDLKKVQFKSDESKRFTSKKVDILQIEKEVCRKSSRNEYGILPDELCINLTNYVNSDLLYFKSSIIDELSLKKEIKSAFDDNIKYQIPGILAKYTYNYYEPPYALYSNTDKPNDDDRLKIFTMFYEQILEGVYINENINGIMEYMLITKDKDGGPSDIIKSVTMNEEKDKITGLAYNESKIFNKNIVIKKLFDYYNNNKNLNRATIENYISFYLCANIGLNDGIKTALYNNASNRNLATKNRVNSEYYKEEIGKTQIDMFEKFAEIITSLSK